MCTCRFAPAGGRLRSQSLDFGDMWTYGCPKSPIWSSQCSASVTSGDDEEYGHNKECRAIAVIGQASEVVELGRVALSCHMAMDRLCQEMRDACWMSQTLQRTSQLTVPCSTKRQRVAYDQVEIARALATSRTAAQMTSRFRHIENTGRSGGPIDTSPHFSSLRVCFCEKRICVFIATFGVARFTLQTPKLRLVGWLVSRPVARDL